MPPLPGCLLITLRFLSRFSPRASLEKQHGEILADLAKIQPQRPQATQNEASMRNSRNGMMSARGRRMSTVAGLEGMGASAGQQGAILRGLCWPARLEPQGWVDGTAARQQRFHFRGLHWPGRFLCHSMKGAGVSVGQQVAPRAGGCTAWQSFSQRSWRAWTAVQVEINSPCDTLQGNERTALQGFVTGRKQDASACEQETLREKVAHICKASATGWRRWPPQHCSLLGKGCKPHAHQ